MDDYTRSQIQNSQVLQEELQKLADNATTESDRISYQRELERQEQTERNLYNS